MLSASRRQPHLLHVSAVDRRQTWSMDKSWRCVTLSRFLHSHIVRCRWTPFLVACITVALACPKRFSSDHWRLWRSKLGSRIVGSTTKVELTTVADCQSSLHRLVTSIDCMSHHSGLHDSRRSGGGWKTSSYNGQSRWHSACVINLSVAALHLCCGATKCVDYTERHNFYLVTAADLDWLTAFLFVCNRHVFLRLFHASLSLPNVSKGTFVLLELLMSPNKQSQSTGRFADDLDELTTFVCTKQTY